MRGRFLATHRKEDVGIILAILALIVATLAFKSDYLMAAKSDNYLA